MLKELLEAKDLPLKVEIKIWDAIGEWCKVKKSGVVAGALQTIFNWCR